METERGFEVRAASGWGARAFALTLGLSICLPGAAASQALRGSVLDRSSGSPVPFAELTVLDPAGTVVRSLLADDAGAFLVATPDSIMVRAAALGYESETSSLIVIEPGEVVTIEITLGVRPMPLDPVTVIARTPAPARLERFYERVEMNRKIGRGRIWTREDIEREKPLEIRHLTYAVPGGSAAPGFRGCDGFAAYVDGMPVTMDELDLVVSPHEVEGVEIYRRSAVLYLPPLARHPVEDACGIVLVWRKPYGEGASPFTWTNALIAIGFGVLLGVLR